MGLSPLWTEWRPVAASFSGHDTKTDEQGRRRHPRRAG